VNDPPIMDYVHVRNGFGDAWRELERRVCRIAYLGNSVTAQRNGYRQLLHDRLVAQSGHPHHSINAGFSATGSIGCLYTLTDFVLKHSPDLCFIECTTGDKGVKTPPNKIGPVLEGIVRQLLNQHCAPCNLHLYRHDQSFDDSDPIIDAYESLLEHYQIPSINVGRLYEQNLTKQQRDAFSFDGVHLSPEGAQWVANIVAEAVMRLSRRVSSEFELPSPRYPDRYEFAALEPALLSMLVDASSGMCAQFRGIYPYVELASSNAIEFQTKAGPIDGVMLIIGPSSGFISVKAEGIQSEYLVWDPWCIYDRLQAIIFNRPVPTNVLVRIATLDRPVPDPSANPDLPKSLRIASFLVHRTSASL
jgi:lysophospholipase L1-like esterase